MPEAPPVIAGMWLRCCLRVIAVGMRRLPAEAAPPEPPAGCRRFAHVVSGCLAGGIRVPAGWSALIASDGERLRAAEPATALVADVEIDHEPGGEDPWLAAGGAIAAPAADPAAAAAACRAVAALSPDGSAWSDPRLRARPLLDALLTAFLADAIAAGALPPRRQPAWIDRLALDVRREAFRRPLDAGGLARLAGRSREHVSRELRRHLGAPATRVLRAWQVEAAARMLSQGAIGAAEAARRTHLGSDRSFRRDFRRRFGMPPRRGCASRTARAGRTPRIAPPRSMRRPPRRRGRRADCACIMRESTADPSSAALGAQAATGTGSGTSCAKARRSSMDRGASPSIPAWTPSSPAIADSSAMRAGMRRR